MKTLDRNAAEQLFEKVKSLAHQPNSWRCIYINLDEEERLNAGRRARFVVPTLITVLADFDGYIYLCNDGDIFILFQGAISPVMSRLSSHFDGLTPWPLWGEPSRSPFTIFDLSKYWQVFFNLCEAKSFQTA